MNLKYIAAGIALASSSSAFAGVTANAGVVSEYLFRGIETSGGAAVQGGIDWASDIGIYAGTWASNTGGPAAAGGTELDFYGGYAFKAGPVGLDFGVIYYYFSEDEEDLATVPGEFDFDYPEIYFKLSAGWFGLQAYYTTSYLGDGNEAFADSIGKDTDFLYVNALANIPVTDSITFGIQVGSSTGEGAEAAWSDEYLDYSISVTKALDNGFAFSLGLYNTTLEIGQGFGTLPGDDDSFKPVVGLKKTFDL